MINLQKGRSGRILGMNCVYEYLILVRTIVVVVVVLVPFDIIANLRRQHSTSQGTQSIAIATLGRRVIQLRIQRHYDAIFGQQADIVLLGHVLF